MRIRVYQSIPWNTLPETVILWLNVNSFVAKTKQNKKTPNNNKLDLAI